MVHIRVATVAAVLSVLACMNSGCISDEAMAAVMRPMVLEMLVLDGVSTDAPVAVIEASTPDGSLSVFSLRNERDRQNYFQDAMWYSDRQWSETWGLAVRDVDEARALAYVRQLRDKAAQQQNSQFMILMPPDHAINASVDEIVDESQTIEVIVRCLAPESFANPDDFPQTPAPDTTASPS